MKFTPYRDDAASSRNRRLLWWRSALRVWMAHVALVVGVAVPGLGAAESAQQPAVPSALASRALLTDSARAGQRIVAVGAYGNIVYSDDGKQWRQADRVPTETLLTAVTFIDAEEGWAGGHDSLILHTTDGGRNWEILYEDLIPDGDVPKPILDLQFSDHRHGVAVGAFARLLTTADGGKSWHEVDTEPLRQLLIAAGQEPEPNFNAITPMEGGYLISGELGTLIHYAPAADGTVAQWRVLQSPYTGSFFGALALTPRELLIYGLRGHCFHSDDAGASWSTVATDTTANIYDAIAVDGGDVIAVGDGGTILRLRRAAVSAQPVPYAGFNGFTSVQSTGGGDLLLFGTAGIDRIELP